MKRVKVTLALAVLLVSIASNTAWADRRHGRVGVIIEAPLFWPGYYPSPYYYPYYPYAPPVIAVPSSPPVYIEQEQQPAPPQQPYYWHYCSKPQGYYPYVKECPGGWQQVSPQPPSQP